MGSAHRPAGDSSERNLTGGMLRRKLNSKGTDRIAYGSGEADGDNERQESVDQDGLTPSDKKPHKRGRSTGESV